MPRFNRRTLLKMSLGAAQLALLTKAGATMFASKSAWARTYSGPTKLLTVYVPGGWMPYFFMPPFDAAQVSEYIPARKRAISNWEKEPAFFEPSDITNLDGTGDALDGTYQKIRVTKFWDKAKVMARDFEAPENLSLNGYAWDHYELWKKTAVIHGVDQGTADHASGKISALSGAASANWRSPAIHSWAAHALHEAFGQERIHGAVSVGSGPKPVSLGLTHGASTHMTKLADLRFAFSEREELPWRGIRDDRAPRIDAGFDGTPIMPPIPATQLEAKVLERTRALAGAQTNDANAKMLESLWRNYASVSTQLANDIVSQLEATEGWRTNLPKPFWQTDDRFQHLWVTTGRTYMGASDHWKDDFDLGLRLLKSNLASAVSIEASGAGDSFLDHHGSGHEVTCVQARAVFEAIGRLLGEMDTTPGVEDSSKTLLDETLVLIVSEFSRTWPKSGKNDHHPATSVLIAGGGIQPNRMIGGYDTDNIPAGSLGAMGKSIEHVSKAGDRFQRAPRSADVIHTALVGLGIDEFEIPGGSDLIEGVLA